MVGRKISYYCPECKKHVESRNETQNDILIDPKHEVIKSTGLRGRCGAGIRKCKHCQKDYLIIYEVNYEDGWKSPLTYSYSLNTTHSMGKPIVKYITNKMKAEKKTFPNTIDSDRFRSKDPPEEVHRVRPIIFREEYAINIFRCSLTHKVCDLRGKCGQCETALTKKEEELLVSKDVR